MHKLCYEFQATDCYYITADKILSFDFILGWFFLWIFLF